LEYVDENGKRYKHVVGEYGDYCPHCDLDPKTCVGDECSSFCYLIEIVDDINHFQGE